MSSEFFFFCFLCEQRTAYELRISAGSSDVCSSDLRLQGLRVQHGDVFLDMVAHALARFHRRLLGQRQRIPFVVPVADHGRTVDQIGRASCRERVCQYVWISGVDVTVKKKTNNTTMHTHVQLMI